MKSLTLIMVRYYGVAVTKRVGYSESAKRVGDGESPMQVRISEDHF